MKLMKFMSIFQQQSCFALVTAITNLLLVNNSSKHTAVHLLILLY